MVHGLEMPPVLAGEDVDGDNGVAEQVVAGTIAAVVVRSWSGDRQIRDTSRFVDRLRKAPGVRTRSLLPPVVEPRLVPAFAGTRHGVEFPELLARDGVECTRIAWRPLRQLQHACTDHDDVLVDGRRARVADYHVDLAVRAEPFRQLPGRRIKRQQLCSSGDDDSLGSIAVARKISDASAREATARTAGHVTLPDQLAGIGLECHDAIADREVHHAANDDRHRFGPATQAATAATATGRRWKPVGPRLCELRDVCRVDLSEW